MLKKIKNLKCPEIHLLASFANVDLDRMSRGEEISEDELKYGDLLANSGHPENKNNELDVENVIDNLMFDNYGVYLQFKNKEKLNVDDYFLEDLSENERQKIEEGEENIRKYIKLYERLMFESKFEYANIRSVQKSMLEKRMQTAIARENYELCVVLKQRIQEI